jgi:hypothetical protein
MSTESRTCALGMEGWSQRSIFGWDEQLGSWWAQLWRDGSTNALPDVWIAHAGSQVSRLVQLVTDRIGLPSGVVDWALAESLEPPPERSWRNPSSRHRSGAGGST